MSLKTFNVVWVEGLPETAKRARNPLHAWWIEFIFSLDYPWCKVTTWNGLTSDKRDPIDIARQMDDFMRVRRLRY